ncbi:VPS10 domain-containing protein [Flavicella sediminum]|uniref:VPS10 domain-containing protein n=1 Tax=Flavicella sediminum TaxID=2585141 RepID=UPI00111F395C|nr:T9SS type A sorting domain-containing protein [Flavicella sediminum]
MKLFVQLVCFLCINTIAQAQLNSSYFQKLKTEKISSSEEITWNQFGPGMAGYCEEFWCHPTDENVMFMSPDMYNSYGTWDNGLSWHTIKDYDGTGKDMRRVQSIVFSHQNPDLGYAIDVRGELYKSIDRGRSWEFIKDLGGKHAELAVDPTNDNNWYIGGGDFWNVKANHRKQNDLLGYVYTYSDYGQVFKSTDQGKTWKKIKSGLPATLDVGRIIVDPRNSKHIVMATNSGIYRSTDQGETWTTSRNGLPNNSPRDMTSYFDANTKEYILYVIEQTFYSADGSSVKSTGGVYKSTDGGVSWTNATGNLGIDLTQVTNYTSTSKYWRAIAYWFDISQTEAKATYPNYPTQILSVFNRIKVNPLNKNEIYLSHNVKHDYAFGPGDVWKTEDGGETWFTTARSGSYWKDKKNNSYWQNRNNPSGVNTEFAHIEPEKLDSEEYYGNRFLQLNSKGEAFICLDQQIMRSNDKGSSWQQIDDNETAPESNAWVGRGGSNLPGRFMLLETGIKNRQLFCSGEHGLWQSADLGSYPNKNAVAVKQIEGQLNTKGATSIATVAVHPNDPNIIYFLTFRQDQRGQLRKSTDGGKTWFNVSKPINLTGNESSDHVFQYSLTIDYDNPNNMYFCVISNRIAEVSGSHTIPGFNDFGVYRSQDGGLTWSIENTGLPNNASVRRLKMDTDNPNILYAALNKGTDGANGGLYKTTNKGNQWTKMNIPSSIKAVNNVFVDRNNKYIYISCGTEEGSFNEGGVWRSKDEGSSWEKIFDMPYVWQTETSPVNPNIITVNVPLQHENKGATTFNPGAYISRDGGLTWIKANKNLGQPDTITDLKPDPYTEGVYWVALKGSGWAKGIIAADLKTPKDTFIIKTTAATCVDSANGILAISTESNTLYKATLTGSNFNKSFDFSMNVTTENLKPGNYQLKIENPNDPNFEENYGLVISAPDILGMTSKINPYKHEVQLHVSGSKNYTILLNDDLYHSSSSSYSLPLHYGINNLKITSEKECQGILEETFFIKSTISSYPNPFKNQLILDFSFDNSTEAMVTIFTTMGSLAYQQKKEIIDHKLLLNTEFLSKGSYILSVNTKLTSEKTTIFKN